MKITSIQNDNDPRNPDLQITLSFREATFISAANVLFICGGDIVLADKMITMIALCHNQAEVSDCVAGLELSNQQVFKGNASANVELQKLLLQIRMERNLILSN